MNRLILFTKFPTEGKVKTRLIPNLGKKKATETHQELTQISLNTIKKLQESFPVEAIIYYKGASLNEMETWLGNEIPFFEQCDGDLGQKMSSACENEFKKGFDKVLIMGTDCPYLTTDILQKGFEKLEKNDAVWGPAIDGGYYSVGLKNHTPQVFENIAWSTSEVLEQSIKVIESLKKSYSLLDELSDIDEIEDYLNWKKTKKNF